MRISRIVLLYFITGVVMYGGGVIKFEESGLAQFFVSRSGTTFGPNNALAQNLGAVGGAITELVNQFIGAVQLVWNLVIGLLGFINWPVVVLAGNNAPPMATLLLGGMFCLGFYMSVIRLVQSSA